MINTVLDVLWLENVVRIELRSVFISVTDLLSNKCINSQDREFVLIAQNVGTNSF